MNTHTSNTMVSVIIPTYNRKELVCRAIESVLQQDYKNYKIIVIDDGSTDNTCTYLQSVYPQIVIHKMQHNSGIAAARNKGIEISSSPFIAFLDSDDEWEKYKLSKHVDFMEKNPSFFISHTDEKWIRKDKLVNKPKKYKKYGGDVYSHCLPVTMIGPSTVMIKRELFEIIGNFDTNMDACEDYDLWLRICCQYPVGYIDEPLTIKYGGHEDQLSVTVGNLDNYRVISLIKVLNHGYLNKKQKKITLDELKRKVSIIISGLRKKNKMHEIGIYESILKDFRIDF